MISTHCTPKAASACNRGRIASLRLAAIILGGLLGYHAAADVTMNTEMQTKLLKEAASPASDMSDRRQALAQLGDTRDNTIVAPLKALLARPRPPHEEIENWDPVGAERVIDLHIIRTLHRLGDDSEIHRIATLVGQAHSTLQGPDDELNNCVATLLEVGQMEPLKEIVSLTSTQDPLAVRNAVVVLDRLALPEPPTGQDLADLTKGVSPLTFTITRLSEELEAIASNSQGLVALSPSVKTWVTSHDYERGKVQRSGMPLSEILSRDIRLLGFDYYVEGKQIVVCTVAEAGARWRSWWPDHYSKLEYDRMERRFVARNRQ